MLSNTSRILTLILVRYVLLVDTTHRDDIQTQSLYKIEKHTVDARKLMRDHSHDRLNGANFNQSQ
jgi:hypothetical protein